MERLFMSNIKFNREWAMPNHNTFEIKPIFNFVKRYLDASSISVDPFARNSKLANYTNDLNPKTDAMYHMDAIQFIKLLKVSTLVADLVIIDPPYTPRQISECYKELGMKVTQKDTQIGSFMKELRDEVNSLVPLGGIVLNFGYSSVGMGKNRGYEIEELLLVCSGGSHFDIICMAERKISNII